jgi:hypothetical protein
MVNDRSFYFAGYALTENEDNAVRNTVCKVEGAGVPEVNGEYKFNSLKHDSGFYIRRADYNGKPAKFTLYKCSLSNGGFQWFISITPEDMEPGMNRMLCISVPVLTETFH